MNTISDIMFWISTGLLVPVIVLLILLFFRSLLLVGSFFGQYVSIRKTDKLIREQMETLHVNNVDHFAEKLPEKSNSLVVMFMKRILAEQQNKAQVQRLLANFDGINIAAFIHNNTDVVILTLLADLKSVSIYSVYYLVTTGLKNLITSISGGIVPTLGHAYAESNSEKLNKIFDRYELIIYIATFLLFVLGGILITPFVMIYTKGIYDANYYQPILGWIMVLAEFAFCIREPYVNMAYVANKFKEVSKYAYIEAGINIVLSAILVIKFGIIGVAIATFIAMIYRTLAHMIYLQKNILYRDIKKTLKRLLVFIVSSGVIIILSKLLFSMEEVSILGWIIYAIKNTILALAAYGITILIFYRKQIELIINKRGKINETTK